MSQQRQSREDRRTATSKHLNVAAKCLAIVLLPQKKQDKSGVHTVNKDAGQSAAAVNSKDTATKSAAAASVFLSGSGVNGKEILDDFKQQNQTCYWNPALIESIRLLEYLGFVEPCTVLVCGGEIHLENLRSAWGRRVLKPPTNFTIDRIGDVNGIEMQVIPQTQFIPLPDSLCLIITELNNGKQPATLESIRTRLQRWYSNTNLPSHQLIYDTLGQLIRERKVFHNGNGYCVVTPEMYHLPTTTDPALACTASWLPYHPMYIPVFPPQQQQPPYKAPTRSISCQVTQIEERQSSEGSHQAEKKKTRPRSHSVRTCRGKDKAAIAEKENADFKRTTSARFRPERAKAVSKDLNVKASNFNPDKDKGEKVSLFSKIFGRKKKSTSAGTATASTSSGGGNQSTETEFVTFSAQFPPPEWLWYQQQLERQRRTEEWVSQQLPKSATWGTFNHDIKVPSSGVAERGSQGTAPTESSHPYTHQPAVQSQSHVYATLGHLPGVSGVEGVRGGSAEERKMKQQHRMSGSHVRTKAHGHHHRDHHQHKHREHRKTLQENNYDVPTTHTQHYGMVGASRRVEASPYNLEEDNIYSTPGLSQYGQVMPWHSTPCYDVPPSQFGSMAMPSGIVHSTTAQQEPSDAGKIQSSHNPHHQRRTHRSKRRAQKAYNLFDASAGGNDISIEYKGRMPKKNSTVAQSRDSGVNCVGMSQNRQPFLEEPELQITQEASAYLPSRMDHPTASNTATASSLQPDTMSTQRGTPYTSMDQRDPEGCSQHHPIINTIVNPTCPSSVEMNSGGSPNSDELTQRDSGPSGASMGGEEEEEGGGSTGEQQGGVSQLEVRSEAEGVSLNPVPHYMPMGQNATSRNSDPDSSPQYVAMSYCDSSIGEDGAGGGEVFLCQAEINQFQVPQLVLDAEARFECGNLSSEPDIALSSAGSKDTLNRTADESERSLETVVRSPQFAPLDLKQTDRTADYRAATHHRSEPDFDAAVSAEGDRERQTERCVVSALGNEFQEMGVVDSGFSSPRNNENKENQAQALGRRIQLARQAQISTSAASETAEGYPAQEHKSKHERIKAFVKQSNQLLEQRQFTGHGNIPFAEHDSGVNYTPHNPHLHPHSQQPPQYVPVSKPLHPVTQHQQVTSQPPVSLSQRQHHYHHHLHPSAARPQAQSVHGGVRERSKSQTAWPGQGQGQGQVQGHNGEKMPPSDLKAFQEHQLKGKKFGLNGEFEVVGIV